MMMILRLIAYTITAHRYVSKGGERSLIDRQNACFIIKPTTSPGEKVVFVTDRSRTLRVYT